MFQSIFIVLFVLWLLAVVSSLMLGGWIHVLLGAAIAALAARVWNARSSSVGRPWR